MDMEKAMAVLKIIQGVIPVAELVIREASKLHGFIHKTTEAEIGGIRGRLVWDYIVYNEITFDDAEGNIISLFTSISDKETKAEWNRLVDEFGIKKGDVHVQENAEEDSSGFGSLHSDRDGSDQGC